MTPFETLMETECLMPPRPYHTSATKEAKPTAALRSEREDWRELTVKEQHEVSQFLVSGAEVCSPRAATYIRRHVQKKEQQS